MNLNNNNFNKYLFETNAIIPDKNTVLKNLDILNFDNKVSEYENNSNILRPNLLSSNQLNLNTIKLNLKQDLSSKINDYKTSMYLDLEKSSRDKNQYLNKNDKIFKSNINFYKENRRSYSLTSFDKIEDPKYFLYHTIDSKEDEYKNLRLNTYCINESPHNLDFDYNSINNQNLNNNKYKNFIFSDIGNKKNTNDQNNINNKNKNQNNTNEKKNKNIKSFKNYELNDIANTIDNNNNNPTKSSTKSINKKSILFNQNLSFSANNINNEFSRKLNNFNNISNTAKIKLNEINTLTERLKTLGDIKERKSTQDILINKKLSSNSNVLDTEEIRHNSI